MRSPRLKSVVPGAHDASTEVSQMRGHHAGGLSLSFPVSSGSAIRAPQVGFRSPVLAGGGRHGAAFQTIVSGDRLLLIRILDQAFPGCVNTATTPAGASALMQREG